MARDLHHNIKTVRSVAPVALTTVAGVAGKVVDRAGYEGVEFILSYGSVTATTATLLPIIKEGDATGSMTSVANADLMGTEAAAGLAATVGARVSGVSKNVAKRIGYVGNKRYVSASFVATVTAATVVAATAVLSSPRHAPVAT